MKKRNWWPYVHWFIIINFIAEIAYGFYMVFFIVGGGRWPLWARAIDTPTEVILKRRLYAIEVWVAISGLAIYMALTYFLPKIIASLQDLKYSDPGQIDRTIEG